MSSDLMPELYKIEFVVISVFICNQPLTPESQVIWDMIGRFSLNAG